MSQLIDKFDHASMAAATGLITTAFCYCIICFDEPDVIISLQMYIMPGIAECI